MKIYLQSAPVSFPIANYLTVARIVMIPLVVILFYAPYPWANPAAAIVFIHAALLAAGIAFSVPGDASATNHVVGSSTQTMSDVADGEVRKVDKEAKRITLRHGELKGLDMPPMTMVFQVKDPAMLDRVKPGDKVKFKAQNTGGTLVITEIEVSK